LATNLLANHMAQRFLSASVHFQVAYPNAVLRRTGQPLAARNLKKQHEPDAWLNYFRAARYTNMLDRSGEQAFDLSAIVAQIPVALNNSFEFQYISFMNAAWDESRFEYLLKAHEIAPQRTEIYHDLVSYHETRGEQSQALFYLEKLFEAGEFPASC